MSSTAKTLPVLTTHTNPREEKLLGQVMDAVERGMTKMKPQEIKKANVRLSEIADRVRARRKKRP